MSGYKFFLFGWSSLLLHLFFLVTFLDYLDMKFGLNLYPYNNVVEPFVVFLYMALGVVAIFYFSCVGVFLFLFSQKEDLKIKALLASLPFFSVFTSLIFLLYSGMYKVFHLDGLVSWLKLEQASFLVFLFDLVNFSYLVIGIVCFLAIVKILYILFQRHVLKVERK
ncbi:MAG: hypothetical protein KDI13_03760 [Alphaproteobacteria bacterium]|nr:hypothetical protein [Alphaproteobacteria bacterium]